MNSLRILLLAAFVMLAVPVSSPAGMEIVTLENLDDCDPYQVKAVEDAMEYMADDYYPSSRVYQAVAEITIDGIPILAYHMKNDDPEIRYTALRVLSWMEYIPWDAKEALLTAVEDEDDRIRSMAASILTRFGPEPEIVRILENMLHEKDAGIRRDAVSNLATLAVRDRNLVKYILEALDDPDRTVRATAAQAINSIGNEPQAIHRLIELLSDNDPDVRLNTTTALGNCYVQNERIINALELVLDDEDEHNGINAAISMIRLGDGRDGTFKIFFDALKDRKGVPYAARGWVPNRLSPANILLLPALLELLKDPGEKTDRINNLAIEAILRLGPAVSRDILKLLDDPSTDYFPYVLRIFRRMGPDAAGAAPVLIKLIYEVDVRLQAEIITTLGRIGPEDGVVAVLIDLMKTGERALDYSNPDIPRQASGALAVIGAPAIPFLIEALSHEYPDTRRLAAGALGRIKPPPLEAVPHLVLLAGDDSRVVRDAAIGALGFIGVVNDDVIETICGALGDIESETRRAAASACWQLGPKAAGAVPALIVALKDKRTEKVRRASASALGSIGPDAAEAIPAMIEALDDENKDVRGAIVESLPKLGPSDEIVEVLVEIALDENSPYSRKAVESLVWMGDSAKAAVPSLVSIMKYEDGDLNIGVVETLAKIDPEGLHGVPELIELLDDKNTYLRVQAARILYFLGVEKEKAVDTLLETIFDPSEWVRQESVWAFYRIDPEPRIIDALIHSMDDWGMNVDYAAAGVLGSYGEEAAVAIPRLIRALDGGDVPLLRDAIEALGNFGPLASDALPLLEGISKYDIDDYTRQLAVDAIAKIEGTWEGE